MNCVGMRTPHKVGSTQALRGNMFVQAGQSYGFLGLTLGLLPSFNVKVWCPMQTAPRYVHGAPHATFLKV
jgi:hypothetical protein